VQLVPGGPAPSVQDVLLEQRVERFHGGVVTGSLRIPVIPNT
jgi:hypothetical protein